MNKYLKRLVSWAGFGGVLLYALRAGRRQRQRMDFGTKVVVITGGSRGLGLVLARQFALEGARLALLARDAAELRLAEEELLARDAEVMALPCDVTDQRQVEQALERVVRRYGQLDVLVNNAGIIQVGPLEHMQVQDFADAMSVHFWGPLYTMLAAIPYLRQRPQGRIVNIASIGGEVAVPHLLPYSSSKYALVGLSDGMRAELAKDGIAVTTVSPGLMRTGSHVNAQFKGRHRREYTWFSIGDALPLTSTSAESAAAQILEACRYGDARLVITPQARLLALADRLAPNFIGDAMKVVNRLLPRPAGPRGNRRRSGWESQSALSPSPLTAPADAAIFQNNEAAGGASVSRTARPAGAE